MTDRHDTTITSEKFGLYGIIIGLIGLATAYVALGLGQLKIFEAYMPFIFIFIGAVYLTLSVVLVNSLRAPSQAVYTKGGGSSFDVKGLIASLLGKTKFLLNFIQKYKLPLFIIAAFGAGVFMTSMLTSGSAPAFKLDLKLPSLQFPSVENKSIASSSNVQVATSKAPAKVADFSTSKSGENYAFSFSLLDNNSEKINASGNVSLKILDQSNKVLYEEAFEARESDFSSMMYSKVVETSKINKSSSSSGTATIKFVSSDGVEMSNSTAMDVPVFSLAELEASYETEYSNSATSVDKKVTKYAFEVTLVKMGFFNKLEGSTVKSYFRADIRVKNIFAIETEYKAQTARLTIGTNSYTADAQSTFKTGNIKGSITKEGYLLFKDVPSTISGTISIRAGTTTAKEEVEYNFDV